MWLALVQSEGFLKFPDGAVALLGKENCLLDVLLHIVVFPSASPCCTAVRDCAWPGHRPCKGKLRFLLNEIKRLLLLYSYTVH